MTHKYVLFIKKNSKRALIRACSACWGFYLWWGGEPITLLVHFVLKFSVKPPRRDNFLSVHFFTSLDIVIYTPGFLRLSECVMPDQSPTDKSPKAYIFFLILLLIPYWKLKFWNLLVPSKRSSSDLSEYTLFQIVAQLFRFLARFNRVGILNSRPGCSREVLVSASESGFPFYSTLLTVALFLCSFNCFNLFLPRNKVYKPWVFVAIGLLSVGLLSAPL